MADSERVAELKRKMQEAAQRNKAEAAVAEPAAAAPTPAAPTPVAPAPVAPTPVAAASAAAPSEAAVAVAEAPVAVAESVVVAQAPAAKAAATTASASATPAKSAAAPAVATLAMPVSSGAANGNVASNDADALADTTYVPQVLSPEELARREMNRREFLTYVWGGALLLVTGVSGYGLFEFMYPRFKAGEFGGKFFLGPVSAVPSTDAPPQGHTAGKFWLVNTTDEGVKALYMVCTHLGCLYKWEPSTVRFECPCHGSKFSREGFYIEGPAPRSLDRFETAEDGGELVVDTGAKIVGSSASESPARATPA